MSQSIFNGLFLVPYKNKHVYVYDLRKGKPNHKGFFWREVMSDKKNPFFKNSTKS